MTDAKVQEILGILRDAGFAVTAVRLNGLDSPEGRDRVEAAMATAARSLFVETKPVSPMDRINARLEEMAGKIRSLERQYASLCDEIEGTDSEVEDVRTSLANAKVDITDQEDRMESLEKMIRGLSNEGTVRSVAEVIAKAIEAYI